MRWGLWKNEGLVRKERRFIWWPTRIPFVTKKVLEEGVYYDHALRVDKRQHSVVVWLETVDVLVIPSWFGGYSHSDVLFFPMTEDDGDGTNG